MVRFWTVKRNEPPVSEQCEELVPEEELGPALIDVGHGEPRAIGRPHASGGIPLDMRLLTNGAAFLPIAVGPVERWNSGSP